MKTYGALGTCCGTIVVMRAMQWLGSGRCSFCGKAAEVAGTPARKPKICASCVQACREVMSGPPGATDSSSELRCSFCDAQHGEVMIVSGSSAFVCDGCVATIPPA